MDKRVLGTNVGVVPNAGMAFQILPTRVDHAQSEKHPLAMPKSSKDTAKKRKKKKTLDTVTDCGYS